MPPSRMAKTKIRILLVDDHLVVRIGLRSLMEAQPDMMVVAEAASPDAAMREFERHRPAVTLMDLRMPGASGAEATARIRARFPEARIIILTTFDTDEDIWLALQAGAVAYLLKDTGSGPLLDTIRAVHHGRYELPPDVAARLAQRRAAPQLSLRERQVLELIVKGQSNKEIGRSLGVAENTVKNHVKMVLEKLGVQDRTQAATLAIQRGMVRLP
jgi:two-component system NarL family response regulator